MLAGSQICGYFSNLREKGNVSWAPVNRGYEKVITVLFFSFVFIREYLLPEVERNGN